MKAEHLKYGEKYFCNELEYTYECYNSISNRFIFVSSHGWFVNFEEKDLSSLQKNKSLIHHVEERMLWLKQRSEGDDTPWVCEYEGIIDDIMPVGREPNWLKGRRYYPKPKTKTMYVAVFKNLNDEYYSLCLEKKDALIKHEAGACMVSKILEVEVDDE